jgi:hypothetical protein
MKRRTYVWIAALAVVGSTLASVRLWPARPGPVTQYTRVPRPPVISPDYAGLMIPPNVAPLNFVVMESGTAFRVSINAPRGESIELAGRRPQIEIPLPQWRALLQANAGGKIEITVYVRDSAGEWSRFEPVVNTVATEPIDGLLVYRLIDPVYRCWGNISIRQRDLGSFDETCILANRSIQYDCINCHSFSRQHADRMALQVRSQSIGPRMLLARSGRAAAVNTATEFNRSPSSYLTWHPNGQVIAFASIKVTQFFHAVGETRDVFDEASDLGLYLIESNTVTAAPAIARSDRLETYPAWSPDGEYLYFCSAPQFPIERFQEVKYDLMRIAYDPESGAWGEPETLLAADDIKGSVTHPRVSPDGRFLMFCVCDYGNFSIYHPESDLHLMDLASREHHRMEINSDRADSYHSWSGNSRWIVFSSKRRDGLLTHPYLSYVDEAGRAHKPFILPQKDPAFYDASLKVFNVPELVDHRADVHARGLLDAINDPARGVSATQSEGTWRSAREGS